jgi:hypothetical protein|tara:strand:- start:4269 stop:5021 length:753 start_codon:yes stop_codon:yes gene_type:complete
MLTILFGSTVVIGGAFAQTVDDVLTADAKRLQLAQASQERINETVDGTRTLTDQYRAINKEIDGLKVYNRLMTAQVQGQEATLEDIKISMDQVDVINRQIFPLMERMIDGLEQSIALDIPFLKEERVGRIDGLKSLMSRSDVSVAEKFRKVMEAYQIELDYGSSAEFYKQSLDLGSDYGVRDYNMLRVGRIGLYFQSDDSSITGMWDVDQNAWVVDDEYRSEIRKGLRMARQLIAPELLLIPVQAAKEAS